MHLLSRIGGVDVTIRDDWSLTGPSLSRRYVDYNVPYPQGFDSGSIKSSSSMSINHQSHSHSQRVDQSHPKPLHLQWTPSAPSLSPPPHPPTRRAKADQAVKPTASSLMHPPISLPTKNRRAARGVRHTASLLERASLAIDMSDLHFSFIYVSFTPGHLLPIY